MRNSLPFLGATFALSLLFGLPAEKLYSSESVRPMPPSYESNANEGEYDFPSIFMSSLNNAAGLVMTNLNIIPPVDSIPKLKCPIGVCKLGGYRFGDEWAYGNCPAQGPYKRHTGVDLGASPETQVVAAETGTVRLIYSAGAGWAEAILIEHTLGNTAYVTQYMHVIHKPGLAAGSPVKRGDPVGTIARLPAPNKSHFHFGVWKGPYGPSAAQQVAAQRGALPSCKAAATTCYDGRRTDLCFPQSWIDPMGLFGEPTSAPLAVVSTSLRISQGGSQGTGPFGIGKDLVGTYSITNRGDAEVFMKQLLIAGRLREDCPNGQCPDFRPIYTSVKLAPGATFYYSGTFAPKRAGNYTFRVAYEKSDGKWEWPVKSENGKINQLNVIIQDGPTLNGYSPAYLYASNNKQTLTFTGTDLAKTLYCRLESPDGKKTNIYIPLRQVVNGNYDRLQINTEFRIRGTYYITAYKLLGHTNRLAFEVH